ncbi:MAG: NAD(P)H-dependent glycerol-3-phosphate dehydrogenase [Alphaproteobacteria bacterium]
MTQVLNNISIIGCGAWGTALADVLAKAGRKVTLYARDWKLAESINSTHENTFYLPGETLAKEIRATADMAEAVAKAELVLLVTPAQYLRDTLKRFAAHLPKGVPLLNCAKGIEMTTGYLLSEVANDVVPDHPYATLSGPSFAVEAVRGLPTAVTLATEAGEAEGQLWAASVRGKAFRPYLSPDPIGVEIAGALKNVIAIACGIVEGKRLGQNAKAAVMTRGLAEVKRLGVSRGAKPETFLGLAGVGDMTLTCSSMTSRNFSLGFELGEGKTLDEILKSRRSVAEGVTTAWAIADYAEQHNVDMPICMGVQAILRNKADVGEVVHGLLSRNLRHESD